MPYWTSDEGIPLFTCVQDVWCQCQCNNVINCV